MVSSDVIVLISELTDRAPVKLDDTNFEIEFWSSIEEDYSFVVEANSDEELLEELRKEYIDFDVDERIDLWSSRRGENGIPSSYSALIESAEDIERRLSHIYSTVHSYLYIRDEILEVSSSKMVEIIDSRQPLGKFYCKDNDCYIGCDNGDGNAWVEEFKTIENCKLWLATCELDDSHLINK